MSYGLYISADGAQAQSKRLDVIANNLANIDTVGFKRQLAIFQARYAEAIEEGRATAGSGGLDDIGGGVTVRETRTDFSQGQLKPTGIKTDMAMRGEGFFQVRKGEETLLTRAGNFRLTGKGELVTQQGFPVLDEGGSPIVLSRPDLPWEVTVDGEIRQGNESTRLAIVRPEDPSDLTHLGENLFRSRVEPQAVAATQREVVDGCVERSSVNPTSEIVQMIETTRLLEANLNLMQTQDQMMSGLVNRLLKVQ